MTGSDSTHFSLEADGEPTAEGRFVRVNDVREVEFAPGVVFRPVLGESMLANHVTFAPHAEAPMHVHVEEQIVLMVEGELDFTIDGQQRTLRPGDMAIIPPWVPHGAIAREDGCREIDMFCPPRATLIEAARAGAATPEAT
jgi:quercetin dioxygenase-like cupin family protein